jgi:hypothetical protein
MASCEGVGHTQIGQSQQHNRWGLLWTNCRTCGLLSAAMRPLPVGANGRYTATCEEGICILTGNVATSKLEGKIFTLLDYVLGDGVQGYKGTSRGRSRSVDMLFPLDATKALIVEYDGAYWHRLHPESDAEKTDAMIEGIDQFVGNLVIRIREHPLPQLGPHDIYVPPRPDALLCVRATLLHLLHTGYPALGKQESRVLAYLRTSASPLAIDDLACPECRAIAQNELPHLLIFESHRWRWAERLPPAPSRLEPRERPLPPAEKTNTAVPRRPLHLQPPLPGMERIG